MEVALCVKKNLITLVVVSLILAGYVKAQNCGCAANECCSQYGYCGNTSEHCGVGCKEGPCSAPASSGVSVGDVVTEDFFNGILNQATGDLEYCPGKSFYTRAAFLNALNSYSQFGTTGAADDSKREIAAFFAHVTHETGFLCHIEEIDGASASKNYCDLSYTQYPCNPEKKYFGRGPLQLSWNYNYGPAGNAIKFDGLTSPETVATDPDVSFKAALWFWINNVQPFLRQGFGATIQKINGNECNGGDRRAVQARISYYNQYCNQFSVSSGSNLSC